MVQKLQFLHLLSVWIYNIYIWLDLKVGTLRAPTIFHVMDVEILYQILFGKPLLNKHKVISFTSINVWKEGLE